MKRLILFAAPLTCAVLLSGCEAGVGTAEPRLDTPFSAEAEISYNGADCTARVSRIEAGRWELCVTAPYPLEGLIISVNGDETKLKMYDTESLADVKSDTVSMARAIVTAYEAAARDGTSKPFGDGAAVTGSSALGGYTVTVGADMFPVKLSADAGHLSMELSGFSVLERAADDNEEAGAMNAPAVLLE